MQYLQSPIKGSTIKGGMPLLLASSYAGAETELTLWYALGFVEAGFSCDSLLFWECSQLFSDCNEKLLSLQLLNVKL